MSDGFTELTYIFTNKQQFVQQWTESCPKKNGDDEK
jgi:hypothetical protein